MTGLLVSAWQLVLRRAASDRLIVGAALLTVLVAASLLAAGPIYSDATALSGLRRTIVDSPPQQRGVQVSVRLAASEYGAANQQVTRALEQTFGLGRSTVYRSGLSDSFAVPAASGRPPNALAVLGFFEGLEHHARLVAGAWPGRSATGVVEAAIPVAAARELQLALGSEVALAPTSGDREETTVRLVGIYRADDSEDVFWFGSPLETEGSQHVSYTTFGPFAVARATFFAAAGSEAEIRWRAAPSSGGLVVTGVHSLRDRLTSLETRLGPGPGGGAYTVKSGLGDILERADRSLLVARSGILIPSVQLGILAGAALLFLAGLLAERRSLESSIIRSRGASRATIAALTVMEGVLIAVPAALAAPWLAAAAVRALNRAGPLAEIDLRLEPRVTGEAFALAVLAAIICIAALALPALRAGAITTSVAERGRPQPKGFFQRAGLDVLLAVVAVLAYWQLRRYGRPLVETIQGHLGIDPFLIAAPALGLVAGAVIALRLVPAAAALVERAAAAARGIVPALGTRELARRPQRYARAALLLSLALGVGLFASAYGSTWQLSQRDQADYEAAGDVRVHPSERSGSMPPLDLAGAYAAIPGVDTALPVLDSDIDLPGRAGSGSLLVVDARRTAGVVHFRPDLADRPLADLLRALADRRPELGAVSVPGRPARLVAHARLTLHRRDHFETVRPTASLIIRDRNGLFFRLRALGPEPDGRVHRLLFNLRGESANAPGSPAYPLAVVAVELDFRVFTRYGLTGAFSLLRLTSRESDSAATSVVPPPSDRWTVDVPAEPRPNLAGAPRVLATGEEPAFLSFDFASGLGEEAGFRATPGRNRAIRALPALVTDRFVAATGTSIGARIPTAAGGRGSALTVAGVVHGFPTIPPDEPAALVDLPTFVAAAYLSDGVLYDPSEWWIDTTPTRIEAVGDRLEQPPYSSAAVVDRVARARSLETDPVALGLTGALFLGFVAAAVLAVMGCAVAAAVSAAERTTEFAVLRALGLSARQLSGSLALEGALLGLLTLGAGTALGVVLAWSVLPFVSLTGEGGRPFPHVIVVFPWRTAGLLELGVIVALAAVAAMQTRMIARIRLAPALRTGEDR